MSVWGRLLIRLYRFLLAFYPRGFRSAFGEEMQDDFQAALTETQRADGLGVGQLLWREFRHWTGSVW